MHAIWFWGFDRADEAIWFSGWSRADQPDPASLVIEDYLNCIAFNSPNDRAKNPQPSGLGLFSSKCIVCVFNISHFLIFSLAAVLYVYVGTRVRILRSRGIIPHDSFSGDVVSAGAGLVGSSGFMRSI